LRNIPFLAKCSDELLQKLSSDLHTEHFQNGRVVFEEGDPGDKFYILARGRMQTYVYLEGTTKHVLENMEDGDYFGELALIRPVPRTWAVQARTDCVCLTLNRRNFEALLALDANLKEEITTTAYARMAELSQAIMKAAGMDVDIEAELAAQGS
jgi:ATP-binding cassette subfamily B protein